MVAGPFGVDRAHVKLNAPNRDLRVGAVQGDAGNGSARCIAARNHGSVALEGAERLMLDGVEQGCWYLDQLIEPWSWAVLCYTEGAEHENGCDDTLV